MFEVTDIPKKWVGILNILEEAWVPSTFNYETYANSGVKEDILKVMPLGVDTERFKPNPKNALPISNAPGFRFLSNFTWNYRKRPDVLLKAYLNEFTKEDDCTLILKTYAGAPSERSTQFVLKQIKEILNDCDKDNLPRIRWLNEILSTKDMPRLYNACDCLVSPTAGEGWHLSLIEAMATGLPTIVTGWSAHMDFTNDKYSYLIDYEMERAKKQMENIHYGYIDSEWAKPSVENLQKHMRNVYENQNEANIKGNNARQHLIDAGFTWKDCANRIHNRLEELI
jgi:glycosyltransferase involved in cell wall biosynthesis